MKSLLTKRFAQNAALLFMGALIISSCATTSVSKRRYTGGLNIEFSFLQKKKTNSNSVNLAKANANKAKATVSSVENTTIDSKVAKTISNDVSAEKLNAITFTSKNNNLTSQTLKTQKKLAPVVNHNFANKVSFLLAKHALNKATESKSTSYDPWTLIYIIIALFIPPLAVLLFEGQVTKNFWITLVLFLLGLYGFLFVSRFLIALAIIYAILVILGLI